MISGVANVGQHTVERVGVKIAAPHFNNGTEAAVVGAAARGLDYIHLASQQRVSLEHARIAIRRSDFTVLQTVWRTIRIVPPVFAVAIGKAANALEAGVLLDRTQQFTE